MRTERRRCKRCGTVPEKTGSGGAREGLDNPTSAKCLAGRVLISAGSAVPDRTNASSVAVHGSPGLTGVGLLGQPSTAAAPAWRLRGAQPRAAISGWRCGSEH